MPYKSIIELPKKIRELAQPDQQTYMEAFNQAWVDYKGLTEKKVSRKETATKMAWNAVRRNYLKFIKKN